MSLLAVVAVCAPMFEQHALDRSQRTDLVPPSPVIASVEIEQSAGSGCTDDEDLCASARMLVITVAATDDQTPPDKLGYRIRNAPFAIAGDVRPLDGERVYLPIGDVDVTGLELEVRAVDLNGNVGPAAYPRVPESAEGSGCATQRAGALGSVMMIAFAAWFTSRRRRR